MKILSTKFDSNINNTSPNLGIRTNNILRLESLANNNVAGSFNKYLVNFKGSLPKHSLASFMNEVRKVYGAKNIADVLYEAAQQPENLLGRGHAFLCYQIPGIEKYVFKSGNSRSAEHSLFEKPLRAIPDMFEGRNYGQAIAQSEDGGVQVLIKKDGIPHSIVPWIAIYRPPRIEITQIKANSFVQELETINSFDQFVYDELAEEINYLNSKHRKADSLNPNNLLVDYENRRFGLIDLHDASNLKLEKIPNCRNTFQDMASILIDALAFDKFYNALNKEGKERLVSVANAIVEKCIIAAKAKSLPFDEETYSRYLSVFGAEAPTLKDEPKPDLIGYYGLTKRLIPRLEEVRS